MSASCSCRSGRWETGSSVALAVFKSLMSDCLNDYEVSDGDDLFITDNLILKNRDPDKSIFSNDNESIIEYFTKVELETLNNLNKVSSIGGIN